MSLFSQVKLFRTVAQLDQLPAESIAEVAFAGRSNAGKSSAINAITNRRRLAFVARQPGKTRLIQMFEVQPGRCLVDLPGYGYAKVDEATRRKWARLVDQYLRERDRLRGLVLIMDVRHPLTPLDQHLLQWFAPRRLPIHILLTKADKLSRSQAATTLRRFREQLSASGIDCSVQLFSSQTHAGVEEVQEVVARWLELEVRAAEAPVAQNKNPRLKGSKAGGKNALIGIKAPAQGGEAGDDEASSAQ
jgi:GTP-binding protein